MNHTTSLPVHKTPEYKAARAKQIAERYAPRPCQYCGTPVEPSAYGEPYEWHDCDGAVKALKDANERVKESQLKPEKPTLIPRRKFTVEASPKEKFEQRKREHELRKIERTEAYWEHQDLERLAENVEQDGDFDSYTVDLSGDVDDTPLPAILERSDGRTLLYSGKVNSLFGIPGSGKSWIALLAAHETVLRGGRAILWDFEDSPQTVKVRSKALGFNPSDTDFRYCRSDMVLSPTAMKEAKQWLLEAVDTSTVIIDGVEAAGCPSDGRDVVPWFTKFVDVWHDDRIGVVTVDHVPKNRDDEGQLKSMGPIGSQAKLARVTGAALMVSGFPWSQDASGKVVLSVHKDRPGQVGRAGTPVAQVHGGYEEVDGQKTFRYSITSKEADAEDTLVEFQHVLLDTIGQAGDEGIAGIRSIRDAVKSGTEKVTRSLSGLVMTGLITKEKDGQTHVYRITPEGIARLTGE